VNVDGKVNVKGTKDISSKKFSSIEIEADDSVAIDRSLDSTRFRRATDWQPPGWQQMVDQMAADSTPYEEIRRSTHAQR